MENIIQSFFNKVHTITQPWRISVGFLSLYLFSLGDEGKWWIFCNWTIYNIYTIFTILWILKKKIFVTSLVQDIFVGVSLIQCIMIKTGHKNIVWWNMSLHEPLNKFFEGERKTNLYRVFSPLYFPNLILFSAEKEKNNNIICHVSFRIIFSCVWFKNQFQHVSILMP